MILNVKIKYLYHNSIFEQKAGNHLNGEVVQNVEKNASIC